MNILLYGFQSKKKKDIVEMIKETKKECEKDRS